MTSLIESELSSKSPEERRDIARQMILDFCREKRDSPDGKVHHTVVALRNHFDTRKLVKLERVLGVSWQALIDSMIRERAFMITNGFIWIK